MFDGRAFHSLAVVGKNMSEKKERKKEETLFVNGIVTVGAV